VGLRRGATIAVATIAMASAQGGCGGDSTAGEPIRGPQVQLILSHELGNRVLANERLALKGHETIPKLLRENHDLELNQFGDIVAVDGNAHSFSLDLPSFGQLAKTVWDVNVNGIEIDTMHADFALVDGDHVQVDLGNVGGSFAARANVGAFPRPFRGGLLGKRFPVRVSCADGYGALCTRVRRNLREAGATLAGRRPHQPSVSARVKRVREEQFLIRRGHVLVGPWSALRERRWARRADHKGHFPHTGVPAAFDPSGRAGYLLDWNGKATERFELGTGLLAAMCPTEADVVWMITGTDRQGVEHAVDALDAKLPVGAFQVAATDDGVRKLPLVPAASD
jgi:hypothetical protein